MSTLMDFEQLDTLRREIKRDRSIARSVAMSIAEAEVKPQLDLLRESTIALVKSGIPIAKVARGIGLSRSTVYGWLKPQPEAEDLDENGW